MLLRIMQSDFLREIRGEPAAALPHDAVGGVRRAHHVNRMDTAVVFLLDPLEHTFSTSAINTHSDPGKPHLECLCQAFGDDEVH